MVKDLCGVRTQRPDGTAEVVAGRYVEPVHLQIVGLRLWERFGDDPSFTRLDAARLAGVEGDVDDALAGYYADAVGRLAADSGVPERMIRDWCETQLITERGLRGQVLSRSGQTRGLPDTVISGLIGARIVREEERLGSHWYELAHDRLIEPVRKSNRLWKEAHLHPLLLRATGQNRATEPDSLLLQGRELADVEAWAKDNDAFLGAIERDYLRICREARSQRRRLLLFLGIAVSVAATMLFLSLWVNHLRSDLDIQLRYKTIADAVEAYQGAPADLRDIDRRIGDLARRSVSYARKATELRDEKLQSYIELLIGRLGSLDDDARSMVEAQLGLLKGYNPVLAEKSGEHLRQSLERLEVAAARDRDQRVRIAVAQGLQRMDRQDLFGALPWFVRGLRLEQSDPLKSQTHRERIAALLAASPRLERAWLHETRDAAIAPGPPLPERVIRSEFSPDGRRVVTVGESPVGGRARIWSVDANGVTASPLELPPSARWASFSPDGRRVVTGGEDGCARVWDAETGAPVSRPLEHDGEVLRAGFEAKGQRILTVCLAGRDTRRCQARVWDAATGRPLTPPFPHPDLVTHAEFNPTGDRVLTACLDGDVRVWRAAGQTDQPITLHHDGEIYHASFGPDGRIATACQDGIASVWAPDRPEGNVYALQYRASHPGPVWLAAFGRGGTNLYTVSRTDRANAELKLRVWLPPAERMGARSTGGNIFPIVGEVNMTVGLGPARLLTTAMSRDGRRMVSVRFDEGHGGRAPRMQARTWEIGSGRPLSDLVDLKSPDLWARLPQSGSWRFTTIRTTAAFAGQDVRVAIIAHDNKEKTPVLRLLDGATGKPIKLEGEDAGVGAEVAFSPDGRLLVNVDRPVQPATVYGPADEAPPAPPAPSRPRPPAPASPRMPAPAQDASPAGQPPRSAGPAPIAHVPRGAGLCISHRPHRSGIPEVRPGPRLGRGGRRRARPLADARRPRSWLCDQPGRDADCPLRRESRGRSVQGLEAHPRRVPVRRPGAAAGR